MQPHLNHCACGKKQAQSSNCSNVYCIYQSHGTRKEILKEMHNALGGQHEDTESLFNVADESLKLNICMQWNTLKCLFFNFT